MLISSGLCNRIRYRLKELNQKSTFIIHKEVNRKNNQRDLFIISKDHNKENNKKDLSIINNSLKDNNMW